MILGGNNFRFFSIGFIIMVTSLFNPVKAQYKKYFLQHFTQINGLPQNSVNQLYFDANNYLWIATEAGLSRFDGVNFYNFNSVNTPIISNERFRWILPTTDKKIIAADGEGAIYKIEKNLITLEKNKLSSHKLTYLSGGIPSIDNLCYFKNDSNNASENWRTFPAKLLVGENGYLYALGLKKIYKYKEKLLIDSISSSESVSFFCISSDYYVQNNLGEIFLVNFKKHKLFPCTLPKELVLFNGIKNIQCKSHLNTSYLIDNQNLYSIYSDSNDNTKLLLNLITDQIPSDFDVSDVEVNKDLNIIALGSKSNGFYLFKRSIFKNQIINVNSKIKVRSFYAICRLNDSTVLSPFQYKFTKDNLSSVKLFDKVINNEALFVKGNLVWFGVGDSLFRYDFNLKKHSFIFKLKSSITSIKGYGDTLWVGCKNSISIIVNNKLVWNLNLSKNGFSQVQAIVVFSSNDAYFSNCNGLYKVNIWKGVIKVENLYPNICFRDIYIFKKLLFITSYGNGCFVFDGVKFNKLNVDKGNYLLKSHSIQIDKNENVWISTNNGIFQTTFQQVNEYIKGNITKVNYNYFNDENGIQNSEFNGGCYPSSVQLANGNIYFPSINGLVNFNPSEVQLPKLSDSIFIDKFDINGKVIPVSNNLELKPNSEILNIYFSSPYWYNSYNVSYQYMLEGYNSGFVDLLDGKQHISFTNLAAGNYKLIIKKNAGLNGEVGVKVIYITVDKNFYETWWFIAILIILVVLIIIKLVKIYNKHLVYKNSILEKKVNERTHELADINAYLLQVNEQLMESKKKQNRSINLKRKLIAILTHDIVTPLKFISMVARNSKNIKSELEYKNLLNDIDHTSLRLYENAQNILNWIKYQSSIIKVQKTNVPLYVIVDDAAELLKDIVESKNSVIINNVDPDYFLFTDKNILSIVIQNLVSNAVKHNTSVEIEISSELDVQNNLSKIIIKDNGKGISNETLLLIKDIIERHSSYTITENSTGSGLGFIIVTELLFALDSSFAVHSDLNGTIITILLKLG